MKLPLVSFIVIVVAVVAGLLVRFQMASAPTLSVGTTATVPIQNINAPTTSGTLEIATVVADPNAYHNRQICLHGYYQSSFEFIAMGGAPKNGAITPPYVWTEVAVPSNKLTCTNTDPEGLLEVCLGEVTVCGTFKYDAEGSGHVGVYNYLLLPSLDPNADRTITTTP